MQQILSSKLTQIAITAACAAMLAACGGGGGGDESQNTTQQPSESGGSNGGSNGGSSGGSNGGSSGEDSSNISGTPASPEKHQMTAMTWVFIDSVSRGNFNATFGSNEPGKDYQVKFDGKGILNHSFDGSKYTWTATTGKAFWGSEAFIACSGYGPGAATIAIPALLTEPVEAWKELADLADFTTLKGKKFKGYGCGNTSEINGDAFFQINENLSVNTGNFSPNKNFSITETNSLFSGGLNTSSGDVQLGAVKTKTGYLIIYARTTSTEREIKIFVEEK